MVRARGPVAQTDLAFGAESGDPAVRALAGDAGFFATWATGRPSSITRDKQTTAMQIQTGISVGHEDLLVAEDVRHLHCREVLLLHKTQTVTNVPAGDT